jgi:hypothetical protein
MIFPGFHFTGKTREDRIRVKVRWILFGIKEDQWFSPQKPDY